MKMIITGASGGFGRIATQGLLQHISPQDLILVTRNPESLKSMIELGVEVRFGDFDKSESLRAAFAGGDKMLMISTGRVGQRMPQHTNAINAAVDAGVKHIVYTSFVGAVPGNSSLAVSDHRGTEQLLRESGINWTALRNNQYADFILATGPTALQTGKWVASAEEGQLAHVTRQDCISSAVVVMASEGHESKVYNITGPELLSMRDVAAVISEVSGTSIEYVQVTDEGMYAHFDNLGIPRSPVDDNVVGGVPWCSDDMVSFERTIREGGFEIISNDVELLTGEKPQSLRDFAFQNKEKLLA